MRGGCVVDVRGSVRGGCEWWMCGECVRGSVRSGCEESV